MSSSSNASLLSAFLQKSPIHAQGNDDQEEDDSSFDSKGIQPAIVGQGIISQPSECTTLLLTRTAYGSGEPRDYGATGDLESQKMLQESLTTNLQRCFAETREMGSKICRFITNPKSWDKRELWVHTIREPASFVPPVILGLLLNILDALSYGE